MPIEDVAVKAELEPHLRLYRGLWLSRIELGESKPATGELR
jgi:hypothetical protein